MKKLFLTFLGTGGYSKNNISIFLSVIVAWVTGVAIIFILGAKTLFSIAFATAIIAVFEINKYINNGSKTDENTITIDKAVGLWIALSTAVYGIEIFKFPYADILTLIITPLSFLLFILWKPSTIKWIGKNVKGGLGIVLDDVLAGFAGGFLTILVLKILDNLI